MRLNLNPLEVRILGALMEKELTTPENYPLSLNSLLAACNQKSNRDPVLNLTEADLTRGLEALGARGLARLTTTGGRVGRYCHSVGDKLRLSVAARAVLAELMLRGPQTQGELRIRCERMTEFPDLAAVQDAISELQNFGPALAVKLPREQGRKEQRYAQLLAGMPEIIEAPDTVEGLETEERVERPVPERASGKERMSRLEEEVASVREEIAALRREVEEFIEAFK
jgi:uncharacterized protein